MHAYMRYETLKEIFSPFERHSLKDGLLEIDAHDNVRNVLHYGKRVHQIETGLEAGLFSVSYSGRLDLEKLSKYKRQAPHLLWTYCGNTKIRRTLDGGVIIKSMAKPPVVPKEMKAFLKERPKAYFSAEEWEQIRQYIPRETSLPVQKSAPIDRPSPL